jgi:hypothetical protein
MRLTAGATPKDQVTGAPDVASDLAGWLNWYQLGDGPGQPVREAE